VNYTIIVVQFLNIIDIDTTLLRLLALLPALTIHEAMHAYTAYRLGDPTPKVAGRISLNPMRHLSLLGTLMIIFAPIGWAKPVPINPYNFRDYKWGMVLTAIAGPVGNFILAFLVAIPLKYVEFPADSFIGHFFVQLFLLNIYLMVFNLLPIPPLDGSKVFLAFVPARFQMKYEKWMADNGIKLFVAIIAGDYFYAKFTGVSLLGGLLRDIATPIAAFIHMLV